MMEDEVWPIRGLKSLSNLTFYANFIFLVFVYLL